jgi:hypothetical protein
LAGWTVVVSTPAEATCWSCLSGAGEGADMCF